MSKKRKTSVDGSMSEAQQRELIAKVVVNLPCGISAEIAQAWISNTTGALAGLLAPLSKMPLVRLSKMPLVRFVVAEHFKVDTSDKAEVKISYLSDGFRELFPNKVEQMSEVILPRHHHDLGKALFDKDILNDLGGADQAEVTLAGIYELMKLQPHGENGVLLVNGHSNIFYLMCAFGILRAVSVFWYGSGWGVRADLLDDSLKWSAGSRVFTLADSCSF